MIKKKRAIQIMLFLQGFIVLFHISILLKIVPYEITWAGRLENDAEMYQFEGFSLLLNLMLITTLLIKGDYIKAFISLKIVNTILWFFLILFLMNSIGNLFAESSIEKYFSLLTFVLVMLLWIILRKDKSKRPSEQY